MCCTHYRITTIKDKDEGRPRESRNYIDVESSSIIKSTLKPGVPDEFKSLQVEIEKDKEFLQLFNEAFELTSPDLIPTFKPYIGGTPNQQLIYRIRNIWELIKDEQNNNILFNLKTICCYLDSLKTHHQIDTAKIIKMHRRFDMGEEEY